jgi:GDP-L-fucose synthase
MKILITGGKGYIAKSLYNALKDKYDITSVSRDDFDLTNQIATNQFFKGKYFDVIIHCAVSGGSRLKEDNWDTMDKNLSMYYNLLANKTSFNKLIHFGSGAEVHMPNKPYGFSKKVIQNSISEIPNFYNIRIYAVFDENELDTRFIKSNMIKYIRKEPMVVMQDKKMTFYYMKDLVSLVEYYILTDKISSTLKEYDCMYTSNKSLLEIANFINQLDDYKVNILVGTEKGNDYVPNGYGVHFLKHIGLEQGIKNVYHELKNKY